MSDDLYDNDTLDDDPDDEGTQQEAPNWAKKLRRDFEKANKRVKELEAENAKLSRSETFRQAGVDPNDPRAKWFVKGYDGADDPESVRAAALEAGILEDKPAVDQGEIAEHEKIQNLGAGAETPESQNRQQAYEAEMAAAVTQDDVLAVMDKYGSPRHESFA